MSAAWEPGGFEELVASVRRLNIEALQAAIAANPGLIAEAVPCDEDGEPVGDGDFDLPCRVDLVPEDGDGDSVMVTPKTQLAFEPLEAVVRGVPVLVRPFGWDYADFTARLDDDAPIDDLLEWFDAWFYGDEETGVGDDGLEGVVHYLSDPELDGGLLEFTVDFGSAPIEAFAALVEALASLGASAITVGSGERLQGGLLQ